MSQATDLLNSLATTSVTVSTEPVDDILLVDPETRTINVPSTELLFGVVGDKNVERKYFKCPRYVGDNIDLSTLGIRINYQISSGYSDKYPVDDVKIVGDYITFSWLLNDNAFLTSGVVYFIVCAVKVDSDGNETNEWNTTPAMGNVLPGLEVEDLTYDEEYQARDVLQQLLDMLDTKSVEAVQDISDTTAEQTAIIEEKGAEVLATIPEDYTEMSNNVNYLFNEVANAIKGNLSGEVVAADDVSPVEHEMVVEVHGKNIANVNNVIRQIGASINYAEPQLIVKKTNTSETWSNIYIGLGDYEKFIGKTITLSAENLNEYAWTFLIVALDGDNGLVQEIEGKTISSGSQAFSCVIPQISGAEQLALRIGSGDNSIATDEEYVFQNIQIEYGTEATEYTPYIDPTTVTVSRCGKNLSKVNSLTSTGNATGTISEIIYENTTYTVSANITKYADDNATNTRMTMLFYYTDGTSDAVHGEIDSTGAECDGETRQKIVTGTPNSNKQLARIDVNTLGYSSQTSRNAKAEKIQLEIGSVATDFEAYNGAEYVPASDGTVSGMTSLSPNMTILTDTDGVTIECEYNIDAKTYINQNGVDSKPVEYMLLTDISTGLIYKLTVVDGQLNITEVV